ncbi:MAG: SGNH/GDSL hydrolase family protein [Chloroflexi bacterium]|nr:MAG: SGNH/GDSL hydrolase family protein [Chloroflexota bacterium]
MFRHRRRAFAGALFLVLVFQSPAFAATGLPNSIAATGDSITRAYNTGFWPFTDNPAGSWSTGTTSSVNSHYLRILARHPAIRGRAYNDAKSGALMRDLNGQMATVVTQKVDYITVLMGGNDVCQPSVGQMTAVADFRTQFDTAMRTITTGSPNANVFVLSIPDVYNLWLVLKGNSIARFIWALGNVCQAMLANPLSTAQADVDRRAFVRQRDIDFNGALADVCSRYSQCRFDGNAVFNTTFTVSDVSTRDYFHPSLSGQAKLAAGSWTVGYWGP